MHPFLKRWPQGQDLNPRDYPHSYHIAHKGEVAVSCICQCQHGIEGHEDFMAHLVALLNDAEVRTIAQERYNLTIYNERDYGTTLPQGR